MIIAEKKRGTRVQGLVYYTFADEGRYHAHENPRLIATWDQSIEAGPKSRAELYQLGQELDAPRRLMGHAPRPSGEVMHVVLATDLGEDGTRDPDRDLTDAEWRRVAEDVMRNLGLTETGDHAGVRWAAVRHADNHVHLMATLTREDGQRVQQKELWKGRGNGPGRVMRQVAERYEDTYDLFRTGRGAGTRGHSRAEEQRSRRYAEAPSRARLEAKVRSAAARSTSEASFLQALAGEGLVAVPNWTPGGRQQVRGWSVALPPDQTGGDVVRFAGRWLAPDLSLPALRERWAEPDAAQTTANVDAWRSAQDSLEEATSTSSSSTRSTSARQEAAWSTAPAAGEVEEPGESVDVSAWAEAAEQVKEVRTRLAEIAPGDHVGWATAAAATAGTVATLAERVEPDGLGPLHRAARSLGAAAQRPPVAGPRVSGSGYRGFSLTDAAQTAAGAYLASRSGRAAMLVLLAQLGRTVRAIETAHATAGRAQHAARAAAAAAELNLVFQEAQAAGATLDMGREVTGQRVRGPQQVEEKQPAGRTQQAGESYTQDAHEQLRAWQEAQKERGGPQRPAGSQPGTGPVRRPKRGQGRDRDDGQDR